MAKVALEQRRPHTFFKSAVPSFFSREVLAPSRQAFFDMDVLAFAQLLKWSLEFLSPVGAHTEDVHVVDAPFKCRRYSHTCFVL